MATEVGDRVRLDYVGRFESGAVFATSRRELAVEHGLLDPDADRDAGAPLSFVVGAGEVIPGLEEAAVGLSVGEERTVRIPPADAYGEYDPERVREYDAETFAAMTDQEPAIGLHVEAQNGLHGDVTAVADGTVEVDFNHELAGRTLVFELRRLPEE